MITLNADIRGLGNLPCRTLPQALRDRMAKYPNYWTRQYVEIFLCECGYGWSRVAEIMRDIA